MVFEGALHDGAIAISIARNHVALFARQLLLRKHELTFDPVQYLVAFLAQ